MFRNYLKVAARNLRKYKAHSLINVVGLALGLACSILIAFYIRHELRYDRFFAHGDRLFRVTMSLTVDGKLNESSSIEFPIAPLLRQFPEVGETARLINLSKHVMGHTLFEVYSGPYADDSLWRQEFF